MTHDSGGPRKEFLGTMVRAIKDKLFVAAEDRQHVLRQDVVLENRREYFFAGLMFGKNVVSSNFQLYTIVYVDSFKKSEKPAQPFYLLLLLLQR